ncbi:2-amino-4-hydroxy-6-hydroxymethyldihydropteridine diphosphokinase [Babesia caballi]|uniref:2-amino-4-hydroxy-6-hydroxymethyldihydropteridine diphosphokinase n=1 Tax=Babesia caballi TaxID=5871 RepID=A0AAV4M1B4_BABCB|nr:2-amino-4-hydroxy-6-hydroxymethyldihydropteridine diphosphokinase [Babesia caballi]
MAPGGVADGPIFAPTYLAQETHSSATRLLRVVHAPKSVAAHQNELVAAEVQRSLPKGPRALDAEALHAAKSSLSVAKTDLKSPRERETSISPLTRPPSTVPP